MLDHMMTLEQAARFAAAKGCTAKPSATGSSLDFFDATGKLIGATMIDRAQPLPVVTRHAVKLALNDRTAI